jgi:hypothetical protein
MRGKKTVRLAVGTVAAVVTLASAPSANAVRAVFVANQDTNDISQYKFDDAGVLSANGSVMTASPGTPPRDVVVSPDGRSAP